MEKPFIFAIYYPDTVCTMVVTSEKEVDALDIASLLAPNAIKIECLGEVLQ